MTFAGFDLAPELRDLRDLMARFVREQIVPAERAAGAEAKELPGGVLGELRAKARAAGLWCLEAPQEYGGGGLGAFEMAVLHEEACKHKFAFPHAGGGVFGHSPPVVLYQGSESLIERFVRPTVEHGWTSFTAIAESDGGTDPARAIRTTAVRKGDSYVLTGRKMWITNADRAHYGVIYARTSAGISAFAVETSSAGFRTRPIPVIRDHWPTEVVLDDVVVPAENLIGDEGAGLSLAAGWLVRGRLGYAARAVGIAAEAIRLATEWAIDRETFGAVLASRQSVQWAIADAQISVNAARWLTWEAAWRHDAGEDARLAAAMAKLFATEMAYKTVDAMMQILGGMGVARELPLEHWLRDLRVARLVEGSSEALRMQVARKVIGPAVSGKKADRPA
ncbi:acyl-CoA dehydrogenase [Phytohabitans suffuscus]|uniref:Acyl-CoA dehydrogenase n=1 Tax=Phytohabitans suffuscus TaxID=624315 RepID=A0A6F8YQX0_9ACTN|nr:acyl-CoA dehydrogenase [Phytohabitans suffuscus]